MDDEFNTIRAKLLEFELNGITIEQKAILSKAFDGLLHDALGRRDALTVVHIQELQKRLDALRPKEPKSSDLETRDNKKGPPWYSTWPVGVIILIVFAIVLYKNGWRPTEIDLGVSKWFQSTPTPTVTPPLSTASLATSTTVPSLISTLTQAKVTTILPTKGLLGQLNNIWSLTSYTSLYTSGKPIYNITIDANQAYYSESQWCSTKPSNFKFLSLQYFIDNIKVPDTNIMQYDVGQDMAQGTNKAKISENCHYWTFILTNWQPHSTVKLDALFHISEIIYDVAGYYQPGEYDQQIIINVN